jgi:hypothetical protein
MYQVDADFVRILEDVSVHEEAEAPDEDFFTQLGQDNVDYQGPLFGEAAIPGTPATTATATPAVQNIASSAPPAASTASPVASTATGPTASTTGQTSMSGAAYYGANTSPPPDETTAANQPSSQPQKNDSLSAKKSKPSIEF